MNIKEEIIQELKEEIELYSSIIKKRKSKGLDYSKYEKDLSISMSELREKETEEAFLKSKISFEIPSFHFVRLA